MLTPRTPDRRAAWILAALVALGAALRLYGLGTQSLWNDELSTVHRSAGMQWRHLLAAASPADHPPGYFILMRIWVRLVGDSEAQLRLPSALFGIAAIPAIYALALRLYGRREGLIAAALTAAAWMPIFYSQEARPYALLFLLIVMTAAWLLDIVHALQSAAPLPRGRAIAYVLAASATCYTHYFGMLAIGLQAVFGAVALRRHVRGLGTLAVLYAIVAVLYLPQLGPAWVEVHRGLGWLEPTGVAAPWELMRFFFNQSDAFAALATALWVVLLVRERTAPDGDAPGPAIPATRLLVAWMVVPVATVWLRSVLIAPAFLNRALIIVAPAAYLLVARAITQLSTRFWIAPLVTGLLCGGLLTNLIVTQRYYSFVNKEQFREAAAYVVARDHGEASTLVLAFAFDRIYFDYYFAHQGSARRVDAGMSSAREVVAARQLIAERSPDNVWLLAGHIDPDPALLAALAQQFRLQDEVQLRHAAVWRFTRAAPDATPR